MIYVTEQGDTWDQIAYKMLGDEYQMQSLLKANPELIDYFIFPAGVEIMIPEEEETVEDDDSMLPDWRLDDLPDDSDEDDDADYEDDEDDAGEDFDTADSVDDEEE